jgi:MoaA/NifB/PqqE/SkfB family radical SAM enzyme
MNNLERLVFYYGAGRLFIPAPRFFIYNATYRCDLACAHCGVWETKKRDELGATDLVKILDRPFFNKVETAWVTGGEPTLRKDLAQISSALRKNLPQMTMLGIASNGYATERIMDRLREMLEELDPGRHGLFIQLSIDGIGEVHDRVRGRQGAFAGLAATVAAIKNLQAQNPGRKIILGFNCVIQPENVFQLVEINRFARENQSEITFNVVAVTDQYYCNQARGESLGFKKEEKQEIMNFLSGLIKDSGPAFQYQYQRFLAVLSGQKRDRRCLSLYSTFIVDSDGTWFPDPLCSEVMRVNFLDTDPGKFWRSREAEEVRRRIAREKCPECMLGCSLGDSLSIAEFLGGGF